VAILVVPESWKDFDGSKSPSVEQLSDGGTMWKTAAILIAVTTLACTSGEAQANKAVCQDYFTFVGDFMSAGSARDLYIEMEGREELKKINALAENAKPEIRELTFELLETVTDADEVGTEALQRMRLLVGECATIPGVDLRFRDDRI